jgi:HEAT repeat protein
MARSRLPRRLAAVFCLLTLIAIVLTVALGFKIADAISRFQALITPETVSQWMHEAIVVTLEQGAPEQKLEVIRVLGDAGADAREYSPALLTAALKDGDPRVREAAAAALKKVDPDAAVQFGLP